MKARVRHLQTRNCAACASKLQKIEHTNKFSSTARLKRKAVAREPALSQREAASLTERRP